MQNSVSLSGFPLVLRTVFMYSVIALMFFTHVAIIIIPVMKLLFDGIALT